MAFDLCFRPRGGIVMFIVSTALLLAAPTFAATLQFDRYERSELGLAQAAMSDVFAGQSVQNFRQETFEGFQAWNGTAGTGDPQTTNVGSFATLGGHGTGGSAVAGGRSTEVRNDATFPWARYSTAPAEALGGNWLDSNDTFGMRWDIAGLGQFNTLAFFLTDVADVGARFSMKIGETSYSGLAGGSGRLSNGNVHFVRIVLPALVDSLSIEFRHDRRNDGFGIDGATIAQIAPIPLPPAGALLVAGVAALAGLRRRPRRAA